MRHRPDQVVGSAKNRRRDVLVASSCGAVVAMMLGAAYAAVPLYDWFCRVTGFNGTTQIASGPPEDVAERMITVRFDANIAAGLPWRFKPEQNSVELRLGEVVTVFYEIVNQTARETVGQAGYNVTPLNTGAYFQKINCFCFTEQRLKPGERRQVPVVFYIDPALAKDADAQKVDTITLSYSFYPVRQPAQPVAQGPAVVTPGRI
jgi:cytochrome c oxidase assembly protein subunit 11